MAETPKPAAKAAPKKSSTTRKKTTKRGPTKAAALKALGLTQEDLDTLKLVAQARAQSAAPIQSAPAQEGTVAVQTGAPAQAIEEADPNAPKTHARNLRYVEVSYRLERQQGPGKRRTELKPRGTRGDIVKLEPGDDKDHNLQTQVNYNVIELITEAEAASIVGKQTTNAQQAIHPALAMLRNPLGKEYGEQAFQGVQEEQSYTVAHLDPAQMQGKIDDKSVARGTPVVRVTETQQGPIGNGPIVDFTPPQVHPDQIARLKGENAPQGPAAGLAPGVSVTIAPTERT